MYRISETSSKAKTRTVYRKSVDILMQREPLWSNIRQGGHTLFWSDVVKYADQKRTPISALAKVLKMTAVQRYKLHKKPNYRKNHLLQLIEAIFLLKGKNDAFRENWKLDDVLSTARKHLIAYALC